MPDSPIAKKLQEMLNEEKWTRATLSGYTVNQIKDLDALFHEAAAEKVLDEIREVCDEHLGHSRNSIGALYLSGIISLSRQQIDDSNMVSLINIFADNRKWNIVEYICNRILDYGENRNALVRLPNASRTMAKPTRCMPSGSAWSALTMRKPTLSGS
jgi:transcription elongation factor GreA-like protein